MIKRGLTCGGDWEQYHRDATASVLELALDVQQIDVGFIRDLLRTGYLSDSRAVHHAACFVGDLPRLESLLARDTATGRVRRRFFFCSDRCGSHGQPQERDLIEYAATQQKWTCLHFACAGNRKEVISYLCRHGVRHSPDATGRRPAVLASDEETRNLCLGTQIALFR